MVSESLSGAKLTLAVQAASLAWAESEAEAQTSSGGDTQALLGPGGPGLRGRGTVGSLDRGAGAGSPQRSLRETHRSGHVFLAGRTEPSWKV